MAEEQVMNYYEKVEEKVNERARLFHAQNDSPRASFLSQSGDPVTDSKALVTVIQPKNDTMSRLPSGNVSPASTGSLAGSSLHHGSARSLAGSSFNRDLVLAKLNKEKILSLIRAWEENMKAKSLHRYNRKVSKIAAWEVAKKARAEASLRTSEERLENEKADCVEKTKNEIASVNRKAEEQRALAEARHGEEVLKAEETAAKCRASGERPRKFPFCC